MHKRLSGVLIVCLVFVSVILSLSSKQKTVFGGYGDRNKYTTQMERYLKTQNKAVEKDYFLAVCEGERDTVVVVTVSHLWSSIPAELKEELYDSLSALWASIRDPRDQLLSTKVVMVDESRNKLGE
ncbi:MAG: hypothetical protein V3V45_03670 [Candidatus Brocadiales bacterium]